MLIKTLVAILVLAPVVCQEGQVLTWNPPDGRVVVAKVKCVTEEKGGKGHQASFESEAELHPKKPPGDGKAVLIQMNRLVLKEKKGDTLAELAYERGKKPLITGNSRLDELQKIAEALASDETATVTPHGNLNPQEKRESIALIVCLGIVEMALPAKPVVAGAAWVADVQVPMEDTDFFGTLKYSLESVDAGNTAKINIKATQKGPVSGEEKLKWEGSGTMVYSLKDHLISEFKITLVQKDEKGKELRSLKQELSVSLKP